MKRLFMRVSGAFLLSLCCRPDSIAEARSVDVLVYGSTPGGVAAAVTAVRHGYSVVLADPGRFPGGMMAGGLTKTDVGNRATIGGFSTEFFALVLKHYSETYGPQSSQARQSDQGAFFEPKVARALFKKLLADAGVQTLCTYRLATATMENGALSSVLLESVDGQEAIPIRAAIFIDATYEGDLLAAAGVPHRIGREGRDEYHESFAGVTKGPASTLGKGDQHIQAYNIRSTITNRPDLALPVPRPANYDPEAFRAVKTAVLTEHLETFEQLYPDAKYWGEINGKFDPNKADVIGLSDGYAEADPAARARIAGRVRDHWLSLWYMLQNDMDLPQSFRDSAMKWGLPKDEFEESGHVSSLVYVRESRRMLGRYLLTQNDVQDDRTKPDVICLGSYGIDSHPIQRILLPGGWVTEGELGFRTDPSEIPYRCITPYAPNNLLVVCAVSATHVAYNTLRMEPVYMMIGQAAGTAAALALKNGRSVQDISVPALQAELGGAGVPLEAMLRPKVEIASSVPPPYLPGQEIRFSANVIRQNAPISEIVWNFDGSGSPQAHGMVAVYQFRVAKPYVVTAHATDANGVEALLATTEINVGQNGAPDPEVSFDEAKVKGAWSRGGTDLITYRARSLFSDQNEGKGAKSVTFETKVAEDGWYQVALAYAEAPDRAGNVPVAIEHAEGVSTVVVDESLPKSFAFAPLGNFRFTKGMTARVTVSNTDTQGYVIVDAVKWLRCSPNPP